MEEKFCPKCSETKPVSEFHQYNNGKYYPPCKLCRNQAAKARRDADPEGCRARHATWYQAHREEQLPKFRAHYREHLEERKVYGQKRYQERREEAAEYQRQRRPLIRERHREESRRYSSRHPERRRESVRRYAQANPEVRRTSWTNRRLKVRGNGGKHTTAEWRALKAQYDHRCLMCKQQEPAVKLTRDHIVPVANGGTNDISNIQPLCIACNKRKYTKTIDLR